MSDHADPPTLPTASSRAAQKHEGQRYVDRGRLGAGAMGDVRLCEDRAIGREVALKVVLPTDGATNPESHERFLSEIKIQARLEHPSIVPVYDVGEDETGAPFFTMRRVRGSTLRQVLDGLRAKDPALTARFTRHKLLTALATVCLTLDYAHERGVLHRDLKPSNLMLGDYGETYVLDWGIARAPGVIDLGPPSASPKREDETTEGGNVIGTLGYIAPEQLRGEAVDARADVYALGAILFEVLALARLHPREAHTALRAGLVPIDARPSVRAPDRDIAPELDEICVKATAFDARDRYASTRELHDAIERYLEGDRDLEKRRVVAAERTTEALALFERAQRASDPEVESRERTKALGEVSRALAFDPGNDAARQLLVRILMTAPRGMPEEARIALGVYRSKNTRLVARAAAALYAGVVIGLGVLYLIANVRAPEAFVAIALTYLAAAIALYRSSRLPVTQSRTSYAGIILTSIAISSMSAFAGPLMVVPSAIIANAMGFLIQPVPGRARPWIVIGATVGAILVPEALEWMNVVPPSSIVVAGRSILQNRVIDFSPSSHYVHLVWTLEMVIAVAIIFKRFRDRLSEAERKIFVYAWQLQKLVPDVSAHI